MRIATTILDKLFFVLLFVFLSSCVDRGCTLRAYFDYLVLQLAQEQGEPTTEAVYEVELCAEGIYEMVFRVDVHGGDVGSELIGGSDPVGDWFFSVNENGHLEIVISTPPCDEVHVKVRSGGDVLADTSVHPEWEFHQIKPKYCNQEYYTATVFLKIDEPPEPSR